MLGLDEHIAGLGGGGLLVALGVAVLLGLRHATDPDHLTAVSTLVMSDRRHGARRARRLGLAWGAGHATTLVVFGLPVVLFRGFLPDGVQRAAEAAVGVVIVVLALRLLARWRRGYFHMHPHRHGGECHAHPHVHEHAPEAEHPADHEHAHAEALGRSPTAAYGIGLVHGMGGSAGAGVLLVAALPGRLEAAAGLLLFAGAAAVSMALLSASFGAALARAPAGRRFAAVAPVLGIAGVLFGAWYAVGAVAVAPVLH